MVRSVTDILRAHIGTDIRSAGRDALLGLLRELIAANEAPLVQQPAHAATVCLKVERSAAGHGVGIRAVDVVRVPISVWPAVMPWETSRGYSATPARTVAGRRGLQAPEGAPTGAGTQLQDDDDPLAVVTGPAQSPLDALAHSNAMLFVHRGEAPPVYWSGGIRAALDVAFLTLPADTEAREAADLARAVPSARSGQQTGSFHKLAAMGAGFGALDDPGPYHYYRQAGREMALAVQTVGHLEPFPAVTAAPPFGGDHFAGVSAEDGRFRCQPTGPHRRHVTAILETRRGFFRDAVAASGARPDDAVAMDVVLGAALQNAMEAKEGLYRDMVVALDAVVAGHINQCHNVTYLDGTAVDGSSVGDRAAQDAGPRRPLRSWSAGAEAGAPPHELMAAAPSTGAPSFAGTSGSRSLARMRYAARFSTARPEAPVSAPLDVPLVCAAWRLGLGGAAMPKLAPRLIADLRRGVVTDPADVAALQGLASDASVALYPPALLDAIQDLPIITTS